MKKISIVILTLMVTSTGFCNAEIDNLAEVKAITAGMPADVQSFISRTVKCNHWGDEEPYDKVRAEFIKKAVEKAGCSKIEKDEQALRTKYKTNKKVIEAIVKAKNIAI
jgi:hypothetical protein